MIPAQEKNVVGAEPALHHGETGAESAWLYFGDKRSLISSKNIDVDVVAAAAKPTRARQRVAFGMNAERASLAHDLSLDDAASAAMSGAAHVHTRGVGPPFFRVSGAAPPLSGRAVRNRGVPFLSSST